MWTMLKRKTNWLSWKTGKISLGRMTKSSQRRWNKPSSTRRNTSQLVKFQTLSCPKTMISGALMVMILPTGYVTRMSAALATLWLSTKPSSQD